MAAPKAEDVTLPPEGSKERFDQDLRNLAAKARQDSSGSASIKQLVLVGKAVATIVLFATFANASQRALSPTYGSIPASIWNFHLLAAGSFVGWAGNLLIRRYMDAWKLIAPVVLCSPMVQFLLEGYVDEFGPVAGPVVTEALTVFPVAVFSAASLANFLEEITLPDGVKDRIPSFLADSAPGIGSWAFFSTAKWLSGNWLQVHSGTNLVYTRLGTEVFLGGVYAIFAPSKYLLLALPALLHTATLNTHVATPMATAALNETLLAQDWSLLARQESITGYVSVLQSKKDGYRVMRCDHSLLGGEWPENSGGIVGEPVYGVFAMLEAVRLVETEDAVDDKDANALVIGMGVGTTPSALVSHGINTTVVEIDPVVAEYAEEHFSLLQNNPTVVEDATVYASKTAETETRYNYIVHDVFTGGAEPVDLFTYEFLQNLHTMLQPNGVIAINYAGDLSLPGPKAIVNTISKVFPSCRIFREYPTDDVLVAKSGSDFTNMVIFCKKNTEQIGFRKAVDADLLRSYARQEFLMPQHEVDVTSFLGDTDAGMLFSNDTSTVTESHRTSAVGHWKIMRTILPAKIWRQW